MFKWARAVPITNGLYTYTHNLLNIVVIDTDDTDIQGIGLAGGMESTPEVGAAFVKHFKKGLVGQDPLDNEALWHAMWRPKLVGRRGISTRIIAGIDIALWDIKGKVANMPVYKLLGGFTNRADTYIAGGYYEEGKGLKELAQEMEEYFEEERRLRHIEEERAKAGGVVMAQAPAPSPMLATQAPTASQDDPMSKINKLKEMLEAGVITEDDFAAKKQKIIDEM